MDNIFIMNEHLISFAHNIKTVEAFILLSICLYFLGHGIDNITDLDLCRH